MGATLEALIALQDVEHQIVDIRRQLAGKLRSVERQAEKLRAAEDALAEARADLQHAQIEADSVAMDLKSRDASVNKLRDNLNTIRTNKEYAAVLSQLNNEKADRSRVENRALELMNTVEGKRKSLGELESKVQEESKRLANLKGQLDQTQASFASRLAVLEKQRTGAAERVDAQSMDLFNRISARYDGEVLARVVQPHPRRQEYICDGCNMSLAAERANALQTRDEIQTCGSCGRILYMDRSA
jgi:uncharacterized protein